MSDIKLVDVSIRDGNQSIWGATGLNIAQTLQVAPIMDRIGLQAIDFTSSTHMGVCVRTHKQNPWTLIRGMRSAAPHTPLQFITTGFRFISWETSDPEFMRLAYRTLVVNGISRFALIDPMHDAQALLDGARMIRQEGGEVLAGLTPRKTCPEVVVKSSKFIKKSVNILGGELKLGDGERLAFRSICR